MDLGLKYKLTWGKDQGIVLVLILVTTKKIFFLLKFN